MGLANKIMYDEVPAGTDPLSEESKIVYAVGPLTASGVPLAGRTTISFLSTFTKDHLVVDAHCKRRLFSTKTPTDPDELARRFCTPDNCLVVVLRDNRFLFRLERAPGSHCRWHKGSSSRHQHLQDWLS